RLVRKVISTWTSSRTTPRTRRRMTFDHGSPWFRREELATPPPPMRARSRARLPPTPPSQRLDGGVGGSLQTWSKWRERGGYLRGRVRNEIGELGEGGNRKVDESEEGEGTGRNGEGKKGEKREERWRSKNARRSCEGNAERKRARS